MSHFDKIAHTRRVPTLARLRAQRRRARLPRRAPEDPDVVRLRQVTAALRRMMGELQPLAEAVAAVLGEIAARVDCIGKALLADYQGRRDE
jgi:hypothetical protein